jgi:hypothetical protein
LIIYPLPPFRGINFDSAGTNFRRNELAVEKIWISFELTSLEMFTAANVSALKDMFIKKVPFVDTKNDKNQSFFDKMPATFQMYTKIVTEYCEMIKTHI